MFQTRFKILRTFFLKNLFFIWDLLIHLKPNFWLILNNLYHLLSRLLNRLDSMIIWFLNIINHFRSISRLTQFRVDLIRFAFLYLLICFIVIFIVNHCWAQPFQAFVLSLAFTVFLSIHRQLEFISPINIRQFIVLQFQTYLIIQWWVSLISSLLSFAFSFNKFARKVKLLFLFIVQALSFFHEE